MENTGYKRSLTIVVSKYANGVLVSGYPKTYNGSNAFVCLNPYTSFPELSYSSFTALDEVSYGIRLSMFRIYIEGLEAGLDMDYAPSTNEPIIFDEIQCHL